MRPNQSLSTDPRRGRLTTIAIPLPMSSSVEHLEPWTHALQDLRPVMAEQLSGVRYTTHKLAHANRDGHKISLQRSWPRRGVFKAGFREGDLSEGG